MGKIREEIHFIAMILARLRAYGDDMAAMLAIKKTTFSSTRRSLATTPSGAPLRRLIALLTYRR